MTCRELADFVMAYLDGELQAEQHARFDQHLAECPACVGYLREYRATVHAGREAFSNTNADEEVPASVPEELVKAILDARRSRAARAATVPDKTR